MRRSGLKMLNNLKATLNAKVKTRMQRADRVIKSCGLRSSLKKTMLRGKPTTTKEAGGKTTSSTIKSSSGKITATTIQTLEVVTNRKIKDLKTTPGATMAAMINLNKVPTIVAITGRTATDKIEMLYIIRGAKKMTLKSETATEITISRESLITSSTTAGDICGNPRAAIGIHHHARISEMTCNNATITLNVDFKGTILKVITTRNNLMAAMTGISNQTTTNRTQ
jgi:hypothetical protein